MKEVKEIVNNEYLISLIIHLILVLLLSIIVIHKPDDKNELIVDWIANFSEEKNQDIKSNINNNEKKLETQSIQQFKKEPEKQLVNQNSQIESPTINSPSLETVKKNEKDIELPELSGTQSDNNRLTTGPISKYLSSLKTRLSNQNTIGNEYIFDDSDGNVTILYKVLPTPKITDYGKVTLQFQLKQDGTVLNESILPVQIDGVEYTNECITALKQWKFQVPNYRKEKKYKISFIFKPI